MSIVWPLMGGTAAFPALATSKAQGLRGTWYSALISYSSRPCHNILCSPTLLSFASVIQSSRTHYFTSAIVPHTGKTKVVLARMSHDKREKKRQRRQAVGPGERSTLATKRLLRLAEGDLA